tara:strand:- start:7450 stop:7686 length:237 start_codon:yes stop_codon:yes gene_type:complete
MSNGKGPGSKKKKVKLNRPTSLNVEREIKQNKKLNRLKYKKKKRSEEGKGTNRINNRIKRLKNKISGKSRGLFDMSWN